MRLAIDTNVIRQAVHAQSLCHLRVVTSLSAREHRLVLDHGGLILAEYESKMKSSRLYRDWYTELKQKNLILYAHGGLTSRVGARLTALGLGDATDRTLVAVALKSDRNLVTEDSDFGKGPSPHAAAHANVLAYLTNDLNLHVMDAVEAEPALFQGGP